MSAKINNSEMVGKIYNNLTVIKENGQDSRGYFLVTCECSCGNMSDYPCSSVRSSRVKRCKDCNKYNKISRGNCSDCSVFLPKYDMTESKRFGGLFCKSCYNKRTQAKCKDCDEVVDTRNGNHSGRCEQHWNLYRIAYSLLASSRYRSKKKGEKHSLSLEWLIPRLTTCEVTGIPFVLRDVLVTTKGGNYSNRNPYTPTIDRIDSSKGYYPDNCRVVCWWYNLTKSIYSDDFVLEAFSSWRKNKGILWRDL